MVGPLTVLKMLHCRNIAVKKLSKKRKLKLSGERTSRDEAMTDFKLNKCIKVEAINEQCRVCLRDGVLPIYANSTTEDLADALNAFGGIEVSIDDPYPKYLCHPCNALLQGAIMLRKTAQQSDEQLKRSIEKEPKPEMDDHFNDFATNNDNETPNEEEQKLKLRKFLTCKRCEMKFNSIKEYSEHRLSDEHENKKSTCPICNNTYAPEYFKKHMAIHKQEITHMCDICGKNFTIQSQFNRHRLTHFYDLPFQCSLCPYKGRFSESLKMHMRSHTGEKPYQCEQCPSRFISKSNLNKHTLTHKGEHDFRCEECGRGFYTKRELDMHFKVDHIGIKGHVCRICDKAFGYRKQMMKHELKVHKREKLRPGRMPIYLKVESMQQQDMGPDTET